MSVQIKLTGHNKDLGGGFMVRRLLPAAQKQAVGPFLFFDHFGPVTVQPGENHDVRPHPHIGLATVTYLFEGAIMHRDSLGYEQRIEPGAINWMTAGRGIVHSERGPEDLRTKTYVNHGIQLWAALPVAHEEVAPAFVHTPAADIPELVVGGAEVRVLIGEAFGKTSPVATFAPALYLDVQLKAGGTFEMPPLAPELAIYSVDSDFEVDGEAVEAHTLVLLEPGVAASISASQATRFMVLGGEPLDGHRLMWWNFVSSRKERIVQASDDWAAQTIGQVDGETEFIPLPERRFIPG
ncbi:MAG: pirin family protein [Polaromonas sp.]|uniref:pirin family protein n=1 Tax=Polaromonas sp. TaxID=1869339 RepID=UPI0025FB745D|nr:pirin family protein [Polaromonas sp.]MBI2728999.1 pirin family protein [Polaromonas sp.]